MQFLEALYMLLLFSDLARRWPSLVDEGSPLIFLHAIWKFVAAVVSASLLVVRPKWRVCASCTPKWGWAGNNQDRPNLSHNLDGNSKTWSHKAKRARFQSSLRPFKVETAGHAQRKIWLSYVRLLLMIMRQAQKLPPNGCGEMLMRIAFDAWILDRGPSSKILKMWCRGGAWAYLLTCHKTAHNKLYWKNSTFLHDCHIGVWNTDQGIGNKLLGLIHPPCTRLIQHLTLHGFKQNIYLEVYIWVTDPQVWKIDCEAIVICRVIVMLLANSNFDMPQIIQFMVVDVLAWGTRAVFRFGIKQLELTLNGMDAKSLSKALCLSVVTITSLSPRSYVSLTLPCISQKTVRCLRFSSFLELFCCC